VPSLRPAAVNDTVLADDAQLEQERSDQQ